MKSGWEPAEVEEILKRRGYKKNPDRRSDVEQTRAHDDRSVAVLGDDVRTGTGWHRERLDPLRNRTQGLVTGRESRTDIRAMAQAGGSGKLPHQDTRTSIEQDEVHKIRQIKLLSGGGNGRG